jgi:hypothetical protein
MVITPWPGTEAHHAQRLLRMAITPWPGAEAPAREAAAFSAGGTCR